MPDHRHLKIPVDFRVTYTTINFNVDKNESICINMYNER